MNLFETYQPQLLKLANNRFGRKFLSLPREFKDKRVIGITENSVHFNKGNNRAVAVFQDNDYVKKLGGALSCLDILKTFPRYANLDRYLGLLKYLGFFSNGSVNFPEILLTTLTVQGTGVTDVSILKDDPTSCYEGYATLYLGKNSGANQVNRILVKFDISSIPASATVTSAISTITCSANGSGSATGVSFFRVLRAWVSSEATWNIWKTGSSWATAGCDNTTSDREADYIGSADIAESLPADTEIATTLTASKIQEITAGTFTNNGFLLFVGNEGTTNYNRFHATESASTTKRPKLVVEYSLPQSSNFLQFL